MTTPATFRTRPAEITAMQWTGDNETELEAWAGGLFEPMEPHRRPDDPTETTAMIFADAEWYGIRTGTWIIRDANGIISTVSAEAFTAAYGPTADDMLGHYSRALDEIFRHRVAAAHEARVVAGLLEYATLPKAVRARLEDLRTRLLATACGQLADAYADVPNNRRRFVMVEAGMPMTLTRHQWEASR